jgi:hypothetical protein
MNMTFDQNLFTQVNLDSGSLTMLGSVIHSFPDPGEYRGSVHKAKGEQAVFYITVDKNSSVAQANIDLAALREYSGATQSDCCGDSQENRYTVNPKGYVVFHVSSGTGGFSVHVRRSVEDTKEKVFNSEVLDAGDFFSAAILRPGKYSVANRQAKSRAELVVSYPQIGGKTAYRPPAPVHVQIGPNGFEPARIELKPGQGVVFDIKARSRIVIELLKPDDGPGSKRNAPQRGWSKSTLPENKPRRKTPTK